MVEKTFASAKDIKVGKYILIDEIPCKVVEVETSKTGKHGAGKMRITGIGVFEGQKKVLLTPADADVEVPIIERKTVQIMSLNGKTAQVMDTQTYEIYEMEVPDELLPNAAAGKEVEILSSMGKKKMERIR
ncbi:MAG: translation initiation factor IF-5A [Candidatus Bilamarchaeaceae archaeon]